MPYIHFMTLFVLVSVSAAANEAEKDADAPMKQMKSSSSIKVQGKKVHSEIDASQGPSDAEGLFNDSGELLKSIPKSKALLFQPERILGLPNSGLALKLDDQIN